MKVYNADNKSDTLPLNIILLYDMILPVFTLVQISFLFSCSHVPLATSGVCSSIRLARSRRLMELTDGTLSTLQVPSWSTVGENISHDDVIKWKHIPRYWPFVRGIRRSPVNSPHKGQWHGALMFHLSCVWINGWVNNREAGDLRRHHGHYDVNVMNELVTYWIKERVMSWITYLNTWIITQIKAISPIC